MNLNHYAPRLAGFIFLFLIATGTGGVLLFEGLRIPGDISATLVNISTHSMRISVIILISIISGIATIFLAVMLYSILKEQDEKIAVLVLSFRLVEALLIYIGAIISVLLLSLLSREYVGQGTSDQTFYHALANSLISVKGWSFTLGAIFFCVGSILFSYLFLKTKLIPIWISILGLVASVILFLGLSLQIADLVKGPILEVIWIPLMLFEFIIGLWLLVKGVKAPELENKW